MILYLFYDVPKIAGLEYVLFSVRYDSLSLHVLRRFMKNVGARKYARRMFKYLPTWYDLSGLNYTLSIHLLAQVSLALPYVSLVRIHLCDECLYWTPAILADSSWNTHRYIGQKELKTSNATRTHI